MIEIVPVQTPAQRKEFIRAADAAYKDDPHYITPLDFEVGARIDTKSNPVLKSAEHQLWIARKDGVPVGRVSAIVNPLFIDRYQEQTGHFGFLDAIDDPEIFTALLSTAEDWLRAKGMTKVAGPFSFSVNEECGILINGFDTPPFVMMPHGRPWFSKYTEAAGYTKAQDMHALKYLNDKQFIPERRQQFIEKAVSNPKVEIRNIDFKNFVDEIKILVGIFNNAWADNWGFVPFTTEQAEHMAKELRPIITKENVVFCYVDGEPAAMGLVLPNINQAISDFKGKLFPLNWIKLLWRLKVEGLSTARMPLMGIVKKYQGKPLGAAFAYKIIDMVNSANIDSGVNQSELSWILESNPAMLNMLTEMGGEIYKTYRIYEKEL